MVHMETADEVNALIEAVIRIQRFPAHTIVVSVLREPALDFSANASNAPVIRLASDLGRL